MSKAKRSKVETKNQIEQAPEELAPSVDELKEAPGKTPPARGEDAKRILLMLAPIRAERAKFRIKGKSSIITHAWSAKAAKQMLAAQQMTKEEKRLAKENRAPKDPKAEFEGAKYVVNGRECFKAIAIKKAMQQVAKSQGISETVIRQNIHVEGDVNFDFFEIKRSKCVMREDAVNVGKWPNKTADLRYRPEYQDWYADIWIEYDPGVVTQEQVATLLQHAGYKVGIGEWRPEKNGNFGRFELAVFADAKSKEAA